MKSSTSLLFLIVLVGYTCYGSLSETEKGNVQDIEYYFRYDDQAQATAEYINELYIITQSLKHEILDLKNRFDQERRETTQLVKNLQSEFMLKERQHTKEILQIKGEFDEIRKTMADKNKLEELSRNKEKMMSLEVETLKQQCQALTGGTDKTKRSPSGLRVAFFASLTNDSTNMHTNQPIIFDHSDLNIGNAYSPQYGSFTAPRPGVYVFNVNLLPHVRVTDARLVKNGQILAKTHSERWKQSSQTVIVELQLGDHVSVNIDYQSNVSLYHDAYCTFSGFLLYDFTDTDALAVGK